MIRLSPEKFNNELERRGLSLSEFCRRCGISRQSVYMLIRGASLYNVPFKKMLENLGVEADQITTADEVQSSLPLKRAPVKIQKVILKLRDFCSKHQASLLLFGSQATNQAVAGSDWDFGIYFTKAGIPKNYSTFKQDLIDKAFPYRVDIVVLNDAPQWFWESLAGHFLLLNGRLPERMKKIA